MPPSPHNRIAELHNLAAHAHAAAAVAHGKGDHLSAHELSKQALEHSLNAHKLSQELATKAATGELADRPAVSRPDAFHAIAESPGRTVRRPSH